MTDEKTYRISELADEFDISLRTLRFYEDKGLIRPRRVGKNRIYSYRDRARVHLIVRGKRLGFSLDDIGNLLDLYEPGGDNLKQLVATAQMGQLQLERLHDERAALEASIGELDAMLVDVEQRIQRANSEN